MAVQIKNTLSFIESLPKFFSSLDLKNTAFFIDENVHKHHGHLFPKELVTIIPSGEEQKSFSSVERLLNQLLELGLDRSGELIGVGGGVVTDLTGFVASIYLRGIKFRFLPTTLLAMCDAAIGGKNGINFSGFKNMVGVINQPAGIIYYPAFLESLPKREFNSGMAEVIKHAIINGGELNDFISSNTQADIISNAHLIKELCLMASRVKVDVVEKDEKESGRRKVLNLGHTVGHAIESTHSFLTHGESVAIGMVIAARIAVLKNLASEELVEKIISHCHAHHLPTEIGLKPKNLIEKIAKDKKRKKSSVDFIMPYEIGDVRIVPLELLELEAHLNTIANE